MILKSKRLQKIYDLVPLCDIVADIGTDHGLLPAALIKNKKCNKVIASDIKSGPAQRASQTMERENISDLVDVIVGPGLKPLEKYPVIPNVVVIAGMGGNTVVEILSDTDLDLSAVDSFIIQPNMAEYELRAFLYENGFVTECEHALEEDGHAYVVIKGHFTHPCVTVNPIKSCDEYSLDQRVGFHIGEFMDQTDTPEGGTYAAYILKKADKVINGIKRSNFISEQDRYKLQEWERIWEIFNPRQDKS